MEAEFSPGLTIRSNELLKDGDDAFGLVIARSRNLEITQRGRELKLGRGEGTLLRIGEPDVVGSREYFRFVNLMVPLAEIDTAGVDNVVAQRVP